MARIPPVDPTKPQSATLRALTKIALSKAGTWFYVNVASRIDPWLMRLTGGRLDSSFGAAPVLLLTAKGARSGVERTVPLLYFSDGEDVVVVASSFGRPSHPGWYHNLRANPRVRLYRRGRSGEYLARETEGEDRDRLYDLARNVYSGYSVYEERAAASRRISVFRLSPVA